MGNQCQTELMDCLFKPLLIHFLKDGHKLCDNLIQIDISSAGIVTVLQQLKAKRLLRADAISCHLKGMVKQCDIIHNRTDTKSKAVRLQCSDIVFQLL